MNTWHTTINALPVPSALLPWLSEQGSLTARIRAHCQNFSVVVMRQRIINLAANEAELALINGPCLNHIHNKTMHKRNTSPVWCREVLLIADDWPIVFARTLTAALHLKGAWRDIVTLGNRPLGEWLFASPHIVRGPLEMTALSKGHTLYQSAIAAVSHYRHFHHLPQDSPIPQHLWARRSLFYGGGGQSDGIDNINKTKTAAPLLVCEVFFPAIHQINTNLKGE